jgi:hypothetical protein
MKNLKSIEPTRVLSFLVRGSFFTAQYVWEYEKGEISFASENCEKLNERKIFALESNLHVKVTTTTLALTEEKFMIRKLVNKLQTDFQEKVIIYFDDSDDGANM